MGLQLPIHLQRLGAFTGTLGLPGFLYERFRNRAVPTGRQAVFRYSRLRLLSVPLPIGPADCRRMNAKPGGAAIHCRCKCYSSELEPKWLRIPFNAPDFSHPGNYRNSRSSARKCQHRRYANSPRGLQVARWLGLKRPY